MSFRAWIVAALAAAVVFASVAIPSTAEAYSSYMDDVPNGSNLGCLACHNNSSGGGGCCADMGWG